ncbi:MAG: hypothetical protein RL021_1100, partial [Bacteroidota bacterium]
MALVLTSCINDSEEKRPDPVSEKACPVSITVAKTPLRIALDTMPAPERRKLSVRKLASEIAEFTRLFINYTIEDGLPVNGFTSSLVDSEGNIWFGSNGSGAVRYDGYRFEQFTTANGLSNNGIWQMISDTSGNVLFTTYGGGLAKFNGSYFSAVTTDDGLPSNGIYSLCKDSQGSLWLGTVESGVCYLRNDSVFKLSAANGLDANSVRQLAATADGSVWMSTEQGLYRCMDGRAVLLGPADGLPDDQFTCLMGEKDSLWIGTRRSGLYLYNGTSIQKFKSLQYPPFTTVTALYKSDSINIWVATDLGLVRIKNQTCSFLGPDQGFPAATVSSIVEDRSGNIWFTTEANGVFVFKGEAYQQLEKQKQLAGNNIYTMCEDRNGFLWMGTTGSGVYSFKDGMLYRYTKQDGLASDEFWSMASDKSGRVWMGSIHDGVTSFDGETFTTYTTQQGLSSNMIRSICPSGNGDIWFATTGGGVNRLSNGIIERYSTVQGLPSDIILCALEDRAGALWFGTVGKGVCRFDGKTFTTFDTKSGLGNNIVIALLQDRAGNIWIGTEGGGIARYDGKSILNFSTSNGLPDNTVYGVAEDTSGHLWIGTNKGMVRLQFEEPITHRQVSGAALSNSVLKGYRTVNDEYSRKTGYPFSDMTSGQNALLIDRGGAVWAGTADNRYGVVRLNNKQQVLPTGTPPHLRSIVLNETPVSWHSLDTTSVIEEILNEETITFGHRLDDEHRAENIRDFKDVTFSSIDRRYPVPVGLKLPYHLNTIGISFASVVPGLRELTEYRYILEGYSDTWSSPSNKTDVSYGNLREGDYVFRVCSRYDRGPWSEATVYSFTIHPPWYRTWLMYFVYVALMGGIVLGYNRWRTRRLWEANKALEQKVRERTAEVVQQKENVEREKKKSDDLLLNILPAATAEELKTAGRATPRKYDHVTVLFTDFK